MAKSFTPIDVKRLIEEHESCLTQLTAGETIREWHQAEIVTVAKTHVATEAMRLLKEIPVEEINRDKRGFRVKSLCQDTVDERITQLLAQKQAEFDAFADKSESAKESLALDEKTFGNIIKEEIDRINAKNSAKNRRDGQKT